MFGPYPPPYGGVSVFVRALFEFTRDSGTTLLTYGDEPVNAPRLRFVNYRRFGHLRALLREGRAARVLDATHFHVEYPHYLALPAWLACKRLLGFEWVKVILDGSLPSRYREFGASRRALFARAAGAVSEFVVASEELRDWLRDEVGVKQRITIIPCLLPIPPRDFDAPLVATTERALAPYMKHAKRVCCIGVFIPAYGFAQVAEAVERIRSETGVDVGLVLLDGKFARDASYRDEALRGREWITVLENVPNSGVYGILKRSDAFVRGVCVEGYGISRVEATWCGLPVVATRVGETRGMLLYDYGDVDALTRQLTTALFEPRASDVEAWAARFRSEAEENLRAYMRVMEIDV